MGNEDLLGLAERCEQATGPDRELDADIAEQAYGWKLARVGADYDGLNACEILTENGELVQGFAYPPRGVIPRYFHVPKYTRDVADPGVPKDYVRKDLAAHLRAMAGVRCCNGSGWYNSFSGGVEHPMPCDRCNPLGSPPRSRASLKDSER